MKFSKCITMAGALTLLVTGQACAQFVPYPIETHASTAEEGIANGMANIISAAGAANLMNAQAATEAERARSEYIRNRLQATQTFFDMRRINTAYRQETQGKPLTMEQYVRLARMEAPNRLSPSELDPLNGKIYWPPQLLGDKYAEQRQKLDQLFHRRALGDLQTIGNIRQASESFLNDLRADINDFAPQDYVRARRFLESLGFEANFAQR